jgi:UDP-glucose 4-epimerase
MKPPTRFAVCGAGFIGLNLVERLLADGADVRVLDHHPAPPHLAARTTWVCGQFADAEDLHRTLDGVEVAYHLVSTTVPGDDHVGLMRELADNVSATMRFLQVCSETGVGRVIFASSSSVYGLQREMPIAERAETTPISAHGIHKLTLEKYLLLNRFTEDADIRIVRLSNPYGPGQRLHGRQGFVAIAIGCLLGGEPLLLRGAGSPIRDFIYITDVCDALVAVAAAESPPPVVNIGTGVPYSLSAILELLRELTGRTVSTIEGPLRKADIPESILDISLATRELGFIPRVSMRDGLARTLRFHGVPLCG